MVRTGFLILLALTLVPTTLASAGDGFPASGKVTGDRVNLRSGPSTNDPKIGQVSSGQVLTVLEETGSWLKVTAPSSVEAWISAQFVSPDGVVTGSGVNIRPQANQNHAPIGKATKGDRLTVIERVDGWAKIQAPASTHAWIHEKFVQMGAGRAAPTQVAGAMREMPPRPRNRMLDLAQQYLDVELEKRRNPEDMDMTPVIKLFEEVIASTSDEKIQAEAEKGLEEAKSWQRIAIVMRDAHIKVNEPAPRPPYPPLRETSNRETDYLAVGWVSGRGKLLLGGATHKLTRGGQTVYLLRSPDFKLNDFVGKRVGIKGSHVGWEGGRKVAIVEDVKVFAN